MPTTATVMLQNRQLLHCHSCPSMPQRVRVHVIQLKRIRCQEYTFFLILNFIQHHERLSKKDNKNLKLNLDWYLRESPIHLGLKITQVFERGFNLESWTSPLSFYTGGVDASTVILHRWTRPQSQFPFQHNKLKPRIMLCNLIEPDKNRRREFLLKDQWFLLS